MTDINIPDYDLEYLDDNVETDERGSSEPLPAGWYTANITEITDNNKRSYPRDEERKGQRAIVMFLKVTDGDHVGETTFVRGNYRPELLTKDWIDRVNTLKKRGENGDKAPLWTDGTTDEKSAFFSQRLIRTLRKAAKAQGRTLVKDEKTGGFDTGAITNLPVRVNLQVEPATEQYAASNKLNGFNPFDAVKTS